MVYAQGEHVEGKVHAQGEHVEGMVHDGVMHHVEGWCMHRMSM